MMDVERGANFLTNLTSLRDANERASNARRSASNENIAPTATPNTLSTAPQMTNRTEQQQHRDEASDSSSSDTGETIDSEVSDPGVTTTTTSTTRRTTTSTADTSTNTSSVSTNANTNTGGTVTSSVRDTVTARSPSSIHQGTDMRRLSGNPSNAIRARRRTITRHS
uniref:F-box domain-containing protein n=1 Tax=Parascaris univalens TaxID=6257 RepID=A0A915A241_PARUN